MKRKHFFALLFALALSGCDWIPSYCQNDAGAYVPCCVDDSGATGPCTQATP